MAWWQWLVGILMFILALGVLVGIHELGHLAAAKAFKVYCFNYSIGFGPALISSKRSRKHETIWTLRAIPLGGFVSMYGEGAELDTDEYIPPSRSLEGVARYKRGIIVSAGVILNFILGFLLIFAHNAFFPHISFGLYSTRGAVDQDYYGYSFIVNVDDGVTGIKSGDAIKLYSDPIATVTVNKTQTTSAFIVDSEVEIAGGSANKYMLVFKNAITTTKVDPDLQTSLALYERMPATELIDTTINKYSGGKSDSYLDSLFLTAKMANEKISPKEETKVKEAKDYISNLSKNDKSRRNGELRNHLRTYYTHICGLPEDKDGFAIKGDAEYVVTASTPDSINADIKYYNVDKDGKFVNPKSAALLVKPNSNKNGWANTGIKLKRTIERYSFAKSMVVSGQEWASANTAVFRGLGMLFTGSGDVGGIIRIAQMSSQTLANFGFERYLYLWGMISCNLAIINLLPFPGLDGFTLLVTAYEGIRKKQVPTKLKGIISLIGLALLFALMIFILIKDIISLV